MPATGTHYHVLVPDGGTPRASLAGGTTTRCLDVRFVRAERVEDGARGVAEALRAYEADVIDPALAGGCGDGGGHAPLAAGERRAPPLRVVRTRLPAGSVRDADWILGRMTTVKVLRATRLGGEPAGEVFLDVHVLP